MRLWIAIAVGTLASGCGLVPERAGSCDDEEPYHEARTIPPRTEERRAGKEGRCRSLPDHEKIKPQLPIEPGRCLDQPPSYGAARAKSG